MAVEKPTMSAHEFWRRRENGVPQPQNTALSQYTAPERRSIRGVALNFENNLDSPDSAVPIRSVTSNTELQSNENSSILSSTIDASTTPVLRRSIIPPTLNYFENQQNTPNSALILAPSTPINSSSLLPNISRGSIRSTSANFENQRNTSNSEPIPVLNRITNVTHIPASGPDDVRMRNDFSAQLVNALNPPNPHTNPLSRRLKPASQDHPPNQPITPISATGSPVNVSHSSIGAPIPANHVFAEQKAPLAPNFKNNPKNNENCSTNPPSGTIDSSTPSRRSIRTTAWNFELQQNNSNPAQPTPANSNSSTSPLVPNILRRSIRTTAVNFENSQNNQDSSSPSNPIDSSTTQLPRRSIRTTALNFENQQNNSNPAQSSLTDSSTSPLVPNISRRSIRTTAINFENSQNNQDSSSPSNPIDSSTTQLPRRLIRTTTQHSNPTQSSLHDHSPNRSDTNTSPHIPSLGQIQINTQNNIETRRNATTVTPDNAQIVLNDAAAVVPPRDAPAANSDTAPTRYNPPARRSIATTFNSENVSNMNPTPVVSQYTAPERRPIRTELVNFNPIQNINIPTETRVKNDEITKIEFNKLLSAMENYMKNNGLFNNQVGDSLNEIKDSTWKSGFRSLCTLIETQAANTQSKSIKPAKCTIPSSTVNEEARMLRTFQQKLTNQLESGGLNRLPNGKQTENIYLDSKINELQKELEIQIKQRQEMEKQLEKYAKKFGKPVIVKFSVEGIVKEMEIRTGTTFGSLVEQLENTFSKKLEVTCFSLQGVSWFNYVCDSLDIYPNCVIKVDLK